VSGAFGTISDAVANRIRELHKAHPKLGRDGIGRLLRNEGYKVDANDLEDFMRQNRIKPKDAPPRRGFRGVSKYVVGHQFIAGPMKGTAEDDD
jgi:hypothetical protein